MDGILLILKPPGMTSFDVVAWLRGVLGIRKIGHAGTLDPAACGLLPLCIGKATKAIDAFQNYNKTYRAEMVLGLVTNTQDGEGDVLEDHPVQLHTGEIETVLQEFVGEYEQIPPMFSAVKIRGKRLYELARQGVEVERKGRIVRIDSLRLLEIKCERKHPIVRFDVNCSKGTYIRTLCHDIGYKLGCGAHMSFLIRTGIGPFQLEHALTLEDIEIHREKGILSTLIQPVDILFKAYPPLYLDSSKQKRFLNGAPVPCDDQKPNINARKIRVYSNSGCFLGLGVISQENGNRRVKAVKIFTSLNMTT